MKTLADLKRSIKLGTKILTLEKSIKTQTVGTVREVDRVQGNAFTMNGSWMWWQSAKDYEIEGNTFSVFFSGKPHTKENLIGKYEILQ